MKPLTQIRSWVAPEGWGAHPPRRRLVASCARSVGGSVALLSVSARITHSVPAWAAGPRPKKHTPAVGSR